MERNSISWYLESIPKIYINLLLVFYTGLNVFSIIHHWKQINKKPWDILFLYKLSNLFPLPLILLGIGENEFQNLPYLSSIHSIPLKYKISNTRCCCQWPLLSWRGQGGGREREIDAKLSKWRGCSQFQGNSFQVCDLLLERNMSLLFLHKNKEVK